MSATDEDFLEAGSACADLVAYPKRWINRRVETVEMLSQEETRRRVSVDFTLTPEQQRALRTRHGVVVPISVLSKQPLRNFDLIDEQPATTPLLNRADNGELALIALLTAARDAIGDDATPDDVEGLTATLRQIVFDDAALAREALDALVGAARAGDAIAAALIGDERCWSLLRTLASDYVLFAALAPGGPSRRILKYSYGEDFPLEPPWEHRRDKYALAEIWWRARHPDRAWFVIQCPGAWRARSFHMEIAIPEELRIAQADLVTFPPAGEGGAVEPLGRADHLVNRAALYAEREAGPHEIVRATVEIVAERDGGATRAALTAAAVAALLWAGWLSDLDAPTPGAAVSLLLAGGAVVSGFAAASGHHIIVDKLLRNRRRSLVVVVVCALDRLRQPGDGAPSAHPLGVWLAAAIVCSCAALRLAWSAVRAAR